MTNKDIARRFYEAFGEKDFDAMERFLHKDVTLTTPLAHLEGKEAYLGAARGFGVFFTSLSIRTLLGEGDEVMLVYDVACLPPVGVSRAAAHVIFEDGLMKRIELFHDTTPFAALRGALGA
ncbi:MAG: nuclear transport factor 2 family protein [Proteobacteria bacterium]|nr:nuclear transport factor 2 family protein [Pseudomonadota bacterium]